MSHATPGHVTTLNAFACTQTSHAHSHRRVRDEMHCHLSTITCSIVVMPNVFQSQNSPGLQHPARTTLPQTKLPSSIQPQLPPNIQTKVPPNVQTHMPRNIQPQISFSYGSPSPYTFPPPMAYRLPTGQTIVPPSVPSSARSNSPYQMNGQPTIGNSHPFPYQGMMAVGSPYEGIMNPPIIMGACMPYSIEQYHTGQPLGQYLIGQP